jgi:outer membrane biosynthesis protein TonB
MFRVQLVAAPLAAPTAGLTQPAPAPAPTKPVAPPVPKKSPESKPLPTKKKAAPVRTPPPTSTTQAPAKSEPAPPAASSTGGRGTDAANLVTPGIDFPYPGYINNIANSLIRQFNAIHTGRGALRAMVRFTIRRDGSVAPESIRMVTTSGMFTFDQDALAAVEAAANANAFGPLPAGFREDILPVQFRFEPAILR